MRVYKYPLELRSGPQQVTIHGGGQVVHVHVQDDRPCLWVTVDPIVGGVSRTFHVFATGEDVPGWLTYVGTIHLGWTVWHVFEEAT